MPPKPSNTKLQPNAKLSNTKLKASAILSNTKLKASAILSNAKLKANALLCKDTKMCDCATEIDKRDKKTKKTSHGAQTEPTGFDFAAMFSGVGSMFDNVGPWIPYIAGSALFIMLLGYVSKNVDKMLGMFDLEFDDKPTTPASARSTWTAVDSPSPSPPPAPKEESCKVKCAFRINKDKIRWS